MTPPVEEQVVARPRAAREPVVEAVRARVRVQLQPGDLVVLVDAWVLLGILWASRALTHNLDPTVGLFAAIAFAAVAWPHRYAPRLMDGALDDSGRILSCACGAYVCASGVGVVTGIGDPSVLLAVAAAAVPLLVAGRAASYAASRALGGRASGAPTLVLGGGEVARRVVAALGDHPEYGLDVVGVADDGPKLDSSELGTRVLGGLGAVGEIISARGISAVIVAFGGRDQEGMVQAARAASSCGVDVWVVPRLFELESASSGANHLWGIPLVRLRRPARRRPEWVAKRALDVVVAAVALAITVPVMAVIAALIRLESGSPVILRQHRVGLNGRSFAMLKFRTMRACSEEVERTEWSAEEDRVTRIGRWLRDTGLDELPQLVNVLRGEMSLVGPRPERPYFSRLFAELYPHYEDRLRFPGGVTGWSQVHKLRGNTSIEERARFDNYYIENWSLSGDLKILLRTLGMLVRR